MAEDIVLKGVVLGPDGRPVAGAKVVTLARQGDGPYAPVEVVSQVDGTFTFTIEKPATEMPQRLFSARKEGFALAWVTVKSGEAATLKLGADPVTRRGRVETPDGEPLAGAQVIVDSLFRMEPDTEREEHHWLGPDSPLTTTTDAQGRFAFDGLPGGLGVRLIAVADGWTRASARVTDPADEPRLVLRPGATISGRVLHGDKPLGGLTVRSRPQGFQSGAGNETAVTDAEGRYTITHLPPGEYLLFVRPPAGLVALPGPRVRVASGEHKTGYDFQLTVGGLIRGRVTEQGTGQPSVGTYVQAMGEATGRDPIPGGSGQTTADGTFEIRVPAGKYRVRPSRPGPGLYVEGQPPPPTVEVAEGQTVEGIELVVQPSTRIRGVVLNPDGQPAPQAAIRVMAAYMGGPPITVKADGSFEWVVPPPWSGNPNMPRDTILVATDVARGLAAAVTLRPGETEAALHLEPGGTIIATVVDQNEQPAAGIELTCSVALGQYARFPLQSQKTDARGEARFAGLPPRTALAVAPESAVRQLVLDEAWLREPNVSLGSGQELRLPPLKIDPDGTVIRVFVGDADQKPVKDATVIATGLAAPMRTDEQGQVELKRLPLKGKITIMAIHPSQPRVAVETVDASWDFWPGLILKPLVEATGQITDKDGKPLAGLTITCQPDFGGSDIFWRMRQGGDRSSEFFPTPGEGEPIVTDEQGRWRARNLIPGVQYRVTVWQMEGEGRRRGWGLKQFTPSADAVQDLGAMIYAPGPVPLLPDPGAPPPPPPPPPAP
jgi:hypothetical protein